MVELPPEAQKEQMKQHDIQSFLDVMRALDEYNEAHGLGATMADLMLRAMEKGHRRDDKREATSQAALRTRDRAHSLGLELDFAERAGVAVFGHPEDAMAEGIHPKELRLTMVEPSSFLRFLQTLDQTDLERQPEFQEHFGAVIEILIQQMVENYNPGKLEDKRWKSMLDNAALLIVEFDRLGVGKRAELLVQYMINSRQGTLHEFRTLSAAQCFEKPGSHRFGPSEWHTDINVEGYEQNWKKIYDSIMGTLQNERAAELRQQAIDNLMLCADWAIADMERELAQDVISSQHYANTYPKLIGIARTYKNLLEELREISVPKMKRD
ncbi:MAG: hypothetical protein A3C90_02875 [Candidatus Magasanikbacteria bacterium RIFCSPHIGHO2_02_FULL_51_14]|uniref:Uncharacterized protein n=1 Tax=Candidatus Magasanikbacteria bacterium RIFCSPHIGHO2_02_FULL_51_14 TaxID=1798683 RepID=A0A1F6MGE2_9BACT|nr:MAG: hypothetical protein A3C90_02875 [Candidatus Magasanikbacteria bacterium RIFCSPHIGHO2_02_FULL_51_14]